MVMFVTYFYTGGCCRAFPPPVVFRRGPLRLVQSRQAVTQQIGVLAEQPDKNILLFFRQSCQSAVLGGDNPVHRFFSKSLALLG